MRRHAQKRHPDIEVADQYPTAMLLDPRAVAEPVTKKMKINDPKKVTFRTVTSKPTAAKPAKKMVKHIGFHNRKKSPLINPSLVSVGTPVQDEFFNRTTPLLNTVSEHLAKHQQVMDRDSLLEKRDLDTHPDLAQQMHLTDSSDEDKNAPTVCKNSP